MPDQERPSVPRDQIAVQYAAGVYAVEFPGHDPVRYRLDGQGRIQLIEGSAGVQLLSGASLRVDDGQRIINPYNVDTFAFRNPAGDLELVPFTAETHEDIRLRSNNNPGWNRAISIQYNSLTGDLDRRRSDGLERQGRGNYAVRDYDNGGLFELEAPPRPVVRTGDQRDLTPITTRGSNGI